jgi:hypothetical protein
MDGNYKKDGANKFKWRWGKECNFLLQVAIMILDVRGLIK